METVSTSSSVNSKRDGIARLLLRSLITINFIRFALSFSSRFEGTANRVGMSDTIFRWQLGGFRADFVWLVLSTMVIILALLYVRGDRRRNHGARLDVFLCAAWLVAFVIYVARMFAAGLVDFG